MRRQLPWLLAGAMLLVFLSTLSRWITFGSAPTVARVLGWDWHPVVHAPLYFLLTWPVRWLPGSWQITGLSLFSAVCAALTVGLLARSVAILPHNRTRDQRHLERSDNAFLGVRANWLPPLLAALVCGLQLTFWENAVEAGGEALDLLLFAYVIWELLEYRLDGREARLTRVALAYGAGITNNFAMIGFFPAFLVALVWIKGRSFFNGRFVLRMALCGLAGLLLYLLLPAIHSLAGQTDQSFWELLRVNPGSQKNALLGFPRFLVLLLGLTSLFPVFFMGIKWPDQFGDVSAVGNALTNLMTHLIHGVFLGACLYVAFDPAFSPRHLGRDYGLPLLPFYYLGALSIGYFSGYFLLVFAPAALAKSWQRRPAILRTAIYYGLTALVWIALVAVPVALVYQNLPRLRDSRSRDLSRFGALAVQSLPPQGAVVLSDDTYRLYAAQAELARRGAGQAFLLLDTGSLPQPGYHRYLRQRLGAGWPLTGYERPSTQPIDSSTLVQLLSQLARGRELYYLHPSFGYYFEHFYLQPRNLVYRMQPYATNEISAPLLSADEFKANDAFWKKTKAEALSGLIQTIKQRDPKKPAGQSAAWLGMMYSRALNYLGVEFQKSGNLPQAAEYFALALELNPDNPSAFINLDYNKILSTGKRESPKPSEGALKRLTPYGGSWDAILSVNGPVDEPNSCCLLGERLAQGRNARQAIQQFLRTIYYLPDHVLARVDLAGALVQQRFPGFADKALEVVAETRSVMAGKPVATADKLALTAAEAWAYVHKGDLPTAEKLLLEAQDKYPQRTIPFTALFDIYNSMGRWSNALAVLEKQLKAQPEEVSAMINSGVLKMQNGRLAEALPHFDEALKLKPKNPYALINRAIANFRLGKLDVAQQDYESLERLLPKPPRDVFYGLGEIAKQKKDRKTALKYYNQYLTVAPAGSPEANYIREQIKLLKSGAI